MSLMSRVRIALVALVAVVVGFAATAIFDRFVAAIVTAPILPGLAAVATVRRAGWLRALSAIGAVAAAGSLAALGGARPAGALGDLVAAVTAAPRGLVSTEWPSPLRADLVACVALVLAGATAGAAELAARPRFHVAPLAPLLVTYVAAVALSAAAGTDWVVFVLLAVLMATFCLLHPSSSFVARVVLLRGEQRVLPLLAVAAAVAAAVTVPLTFAVRADPRRTDPPQRVAAILDPIEATRALRELDPPVPLHEISSRDGDPLPDRWRTAALADYDGSRWTPDLAIRPIGATLGTTAGPTIEATVTFEDRNLTLVPLPGPAVRVDAAVETDVERTVVLLTDRPEPGDAVDIVAERSATLSDVTGSVVAGRLIDDDVSALAELAAGLAGDGTPLDRLEQLARTMREEYVLDNRVQGGGLQRAFMERFLRDTRRGNTEQFVTGFVLLARALGYESRVATGFVSSERGDVVELRSSDATVWPEVSVGNGRWIPLDPVPEQEATDEVLSPPLPQTQTPAAPQPPVAPPPETDTDSDSTPPVADDGGPSALATVLAWAGRTALVVSVLLLPFLVAATSILVVKRRRRHRRLTADEPLERIRGAWACATDALVDAGMSIDASATDAEIAFDAAPITSGAAVDVQHLAALSSAATFGTPVHAAYLADDAGVCLTAIEAAITEGRTRFERAAWQLSVRSLRRATRSPVDV